MIILINFSRHSVAKLCRRYIREARFASNSVVIEVYAGSHGQKENQKKMITVVETLGAETESACK